MKRSGQRRGQNGGRTSDKTTQRFQAPKNSAIERLLDKALEHLQRGAWAPGEKLYQQVLQSHPDHPVALHYLGVIAFQTGRVDSALTHIEKAVSVQPDYLEALGNLGVMYQSVGRFAESERCYREGVRQHPGSAPAQFGLANALKAQDRWEAAAASYRQAIRIQPNFVEAHYNLANTLQALGQLEAAAMSYQKALEFAPGYADAHNNLGHVLKACGKVNEAVACHRKALAIDPHRDVFWTAFGACVKSISFTAADPGLRNDLSRLLDHVSTKPNTLIEPIVSALRSDDRFAHLLRLSAAGDGATTADYVLACEALSGVTLLVKVMKLCPISKPDVERALTVLRRALVLEMSALETVNPVLGNPAALPILAALALQCFTTEYVFWESEEETLALERLTAEVAGLVAKDQEVAPALVAVVAAYRPLLTFAWGTELSQRPWPQALKEVFDRQVREPLKERALRSEIGALTPIDNLVSQDVQGQYEENPYPRWVKAGLYGTPSSLGEVLGKSPLAINWATFKAPACLDILIAGCGTGQQSLEAASCYANAHILAVDLSLSSLAYAKRKALEQGCSNLEYGQGDILELGALTRRFDVIESIGVLHHLGDPLAGWRVLRDLLRPGGLMYIAVYSELGRQSVVQGRALVTEKGYDASPDDIRRFRQDVFALQNTEPKTHAELLKLIKSRDFYSLSDCRDLVFHVQEHRFTVPKLEKALNDLGLTFCGFDLNDAATLAAFKRQNPGQGDLTNLALWHQFEQQNPDTFSGMYTFWCQKKPGRP